MRLRVYWAGCLLLTGLIIVGCSKSQDDGASKKKEGAAEQEKKDAPATKVTLHSVDHAKFLKELPKFKGKVVLVDFWGTWCVPCKAGFPKVVKLHEKYHKDGLVCVSVHVSADLAETIPEQEKADAIQFLKKLSADFPNYYLEVGGPDLAEVHKYWEMSGQPAYFVLDREGKKAAQFPKDGQDVAFEDIEDAVKTQLKKNT